MDAALIPGDERLWQEFRLNEWGVLRYDRVKNMNGLTVDSGIGPAVHIERVHKGGSGFQARPVRLDRFNHRQVGMLFIGETPQDFWG